jgi:hypothetical protein
VRKEPRGARGRVRREFEAEMDVRLLLCARLYERLGEL